MVSVTYIEPSGVRHVVEAPAGKSLMLAAVERGIPGIVGDCGGSCSCGTCHVYVDEAWRDAVGGAGELEGEILQCAAEPRPNSRLGCQITLGANLDGLVVRLPAEHM